MRAFSNKPRVMPLASRALHHVNQMLCEQMQPHDNDMYIRGEGQASVGILESTQKLRFEEWKPGEVVCTIASYDKFV